MAARDAVRGARRGSPGRGGPARARARSSRSATRRRAPTRSTSACTGPRCRRRRWSAGAYPAVPALILQGGEDLRTPPASSRARGRAAAGRAARGGAGGRARGGGRRPVALRRATAAGVPARAAGLGAVPARRDARAGHAGVPPDAGAGRAGGRRCAGAGRTVAALDVTLDDLTFALSPALGSPLAGPGLRGGSFRLRRGGIVLHRLQVVRGVRVSGVLPRRGSARLRLSGGAAAAGRLRVSPRGAVRGTLRREARAGAAEGRAAAAGRGRRAGGQLRQPLARADSSRFGHGAVFSSVRCRS